MATHQTEPLDQVEQADQVEVFGAPAGCRAVTGTGTGWGKFYGKLKIDMDRYLVGALEHVL